MKNRTIDLIRHGEPVGGRKIRGQTDDPLSDTGWKQMRDAVASLGPWSFVASSPLSRCRAFADEVAAKLGQPVTLDARLQEIGFGAWEGQYHDDIATEDPQRWMRFRREPARYRPDGAEALTDFYARVVAGFQSVCTAHAGSGLIVCHAGVIRALTCWALGAAPENLFRIDVPYAGISRFAVTDIDGVLTARLMSHAWARVEEGLVY